MTGSPLFLISFVPHHISSRPLVIGEWSLATGPGCTADIFPDCRTFKMQDSVNLLANTSESNVFMRRFFEAQASTFEENSGGWIFWNWKTESVADWSVSRIVEASDELSINEADIFPYTSLLLLCSIRQE